MFTTPATCFCPNYQTWKLNIATAKEKATRKKEQFSLMPEKPKVPCPTGHIISIFQNCKLEN